MFCSDGTAKAGFKVMNAVHIDAHFQAVVEACAKRSEESSEEFY